MTIREYNLVCLKYGLIPYYDYRNDDLDSYVHDYCLLDRNGNKICICGYRKNANDCVWYSHEANVFCLYGSEQSYWTKDVDDAEVQLVKKIRFWKDQFKKERIKKIMEL